jgi:hypothetical protein
MTASGLKRWTLDDFDIGRPLGKGRFGAFVCDWALAVPSPPAVLTAAMCLSRAGSVYLAREKEHKYIVALKVRAT